MYALVKFYDGVHYVCSSNSIHVTKTRGIRAKYSDGFRYSATIIAKNDNKNLLKMICTNIETNKPYVAIKSGKKTDIKNRNKLEKNFAPVPSATKKSIISGDANNDTDNSLLHMNIAASYENINEARNCADISADNKTYSKRQYNSKNLSDVVTANDNTNATICGNMSGTNITNETAISTESCDYEKNVDESLFYDITETINYNNRRAKNVETDVHSSETDYQTNILVSTSHNMNNSERNTEKSTNNAKTDTSNQDDIYVINIEEVLPYANSTKKKTSHDNNNAHNIEIDVDLLETDYQKNIFALASYNLDTITNLSDVNDRSQGNRQTENEHIDLSTISIVYDGGEFSNMDKCVKQLRFSTTEEISADEGNAFSNDQQDNNLQNIDVPVVHEKVSADEENAISTDHQNDNPQNIDVPISHDSTDDDDSEYVSSKQSSPLHDESPQNHVQNVNRTTSSVSSLNTSNTNIVGTSICNDEVMYVESSNTKSTKRNYCIFCKKMQSQFARHLVTVHRNETDVKKFAMLPKKHPERLKLIESIRKNGNFKFNTQVELNTGQLIVSRRPNIKSTKTASDFIACAKCKGFFAKSTIRHHSRVCLNKTFKKNRIIMTMGRKITRRLHTIANETLRNIVFPVMRDDKVTRILRYDELLITYANKMCVKYKKQHQHDMIRARLRLLGRFLLALKDKNTNIQDFQSLYHPRVYDDCISAINIVAGYDNETQLYKTPAVASTLSTTEFM